jgi:hypothetical protein
MESDPDPLVRDTIRIKMSRIPNTGFHIGKIVVFPTQDCVHQQAGQAGGGRLHDSDLNDATAGDGAASHPDTAGPGSLVVHPQSEKCIPDPTFSRSGSYPESHSESASYLSNLDRLMMWRLETVPLVVQTPLC